MSEEKKVVIKKEKPDDLVFSRPSSSTSTTNRLTSLKKPRDLTLGGFKKRNFTPKAQSRKKLDPSSVLPKSISVKSEKKEPHKLKIKGKRPSPRYVQTASAFEAGTFAKPQSSSPSIYIPKQKTIGKAPKVKNIEKSIKVEVKAPSTTDDVVAGLEDSAKLLDDEIENEEDLTPVNIHLTTSDTIEAPIEEDVFDTESIFKSRDEDKLILFQLPDKLPVTPTPSMSATSSIQIKQEVGTSKDPQVEVSEDGLIGKLQILRSGRCRLVLGDIKFDIHRGGHPKILQELVSIHVPPDGSNESIYGNFTPIGLVKNTVICVPEIQN